MIAEKGENIAKGRIHC